MLKSNISYVYSQKCLKIKINSDGDSSLEEMLNMHNVVILITSVFNKSHNYYYY